MVDSEIIKTEQIDLSPVGQKALALVSEYLGQYTADIYQNFYRGKDDQIILDSVNELLEEVVGENKTGQLMTDKFAELYIK